MQRYVQQVKKHQSTLVHTDFLTHSIDMHMHFCNYFFIIKVLHLYIFLKYLNAFICKPVLKMTNTIKMLNISTNNWPGR